MDGRAVLRRLRALDEPWGRAERVLRIGDWRFRLHGLDGPLARSLDVRWGGFVTRDPHGDVEGAGAGALSVRVLRGDDTRWLPPAEGRNYRIEGQPVEGEPVVCSDNFAAYGDRDEREWRAALAGSPREPRERALENLVRYLAARVAVAAGGFALHGAGVLRRGRAFVFCGPSRSGKTTLVALSSRWRSLGDDFALVIPREGHWVAAATPFDNAERGPVEPPTGWHAIAGVWRLHQAETARVEVLEPFVAAASLLACVAFPWAMRDLAARILGHVERFVHEGRYAHLHFARSPEFWNRIDEAPDAG